jgi:HEAT repeat protein
LRHFTILLLVGQTLLCIPQQVGIAGEHGWDPTRPDRDILADEGIARDGASLLVYLAKHCGKDTDLLEVKALAERLASPKQEEREQAARQLVALGPAAFPYLTEIRRGSKKEAARRARECAEAIDKAWDEDVLAAVCRSLVRQPPEGAEAALLTFLPYASEGEFAEAIWFGLDSLAQKHPKALAELPRFLSDKVPLRRAAAGYLLGRWGGAEQQAAVRKQLNDPSPEVRLRTAQGLLGSKHKDAIPTLIALLKADPVPLAWQAEDLLHWVAGESSPAPTVGGGAKEARAKCQQAWAAWWDKHKDTLDVEAAYKRPNRPGLVLIRVGSNEDSVSLYGCDGKPRWKFEGKEVTRKSSFQLLPNHHFLIAKIIRNKGRPIAGVMTECDLEGHVLWRYTIKTGIYGSCRLPNGNTLLAEFRPLAVREINPEGEVVASYKVNRTPGDISRDFPMYPFRLGKDRWLYRVNHIDMGDGLAIANRSGKLLKEIWSPIPLGKVYNLELLRNGRILVTAVSQKRLLEMDAKGNILWELKVSMDGAMALPNGRKLVRLQKDRRDYIAELDTAGRTAWEVRGYPSPSFWCGFLNLLYLGFPDDRPR